MTGHPRRDQAMAASLRRLAKGAHAGEIALQGSFVYLLNANRLHQAAAAQAAVPLVQRLQRAAQEKARAYSARARAAHLARDRQLARDGQRKRVIRRGALPAPTRSRTEPTRTPEQARRAEPPRPVQPARRRDDGRTRRPER